MICHMLKHFRNEYGHLLNALRMFITSYLYILCTDMTATVKTMPYQLRKTVVDLLQTTAFCCSCNNQLQKSVFTV